ncbi:S1 family peptidase [Streptomyces murinus]|uniref:S1 family peptidase n=1 Tax=Streptomyces murinus TaxID=33900 RepID=UPI002E82473F|nr:S1 family peptidase [Streptomyces murinus]WUD10127.1 S1 family peptidase [Streptomyces murinus]
MRHARKRLAQIASATLLVTVAATLPASADISLQPPTSPARAAALARSLGDHRTAGVFYEHGRLVVAVTDQAAAESVRGAGGTAKLVTRSAAELGSMHHRLDQLGDIPNTAWGVEAKTNQVNVEIFDGAPAASQQRIEKVAAADPGAIRINRVHSKLKFKSTDLRGGNGIDSNGWLCTAGFNTANSSGTHYTLTAGHCVPGSGNVWYADFNGAEIGTQTAYNFGNGTSGYCDGDTRGCDWATIKADAPGLNPLGMVRYWGGDYRQIDKSDYPMEGEDMDRIGVSSQDTTGSVISTSVTVNIEGKTLYRMFESNVCALPGDSGGPAVDGSKALGLLSGGTDETVCNAGSSGTYRNYFTKVQTVLNERGLHVY